MKLYHFTTADKVIAIRECGLLPSLEPVMSPDHAVVWLTSQPDVSRTEQDAKAMALWLHLYEAPLEGLRRMRAAEIKTIAAKPCRQWWYGTKGQRLHMVINGQKRTVTFVGDADDLVRLSIDVRDDDANLHQYVTGFCFDLGQPAGESFLMLDEIDQRAQTRPKRLSVR